MLEITFEELAAWQGKARIIDIRSRSSFTGGSYPGAENVPIEEFDAGNYSPEEPLFLLCYTGAKSLELAEELTDQGYQAYSLRGGYHRFLRTELQRWRNSDEQVLERRRRRNWAATKLRWDITTMM